MARYISFAVLLAIIVVIGALFYKVMIGFFVPVFLAVVLVVVFRPLHRWVLAKVGDREHMAAGITTMLIVLIVLIPAALIVSMAAVQGTNLVGSTRVTLTLAKLRSNSLLPLEFPYANQVQDIQKKIGNIQDLVSKQQSYDALMNLMDNKGALQGDVSAIRMELTKFIPQLVVSTKKELVTQIGKSRRKSVKEPIPREKIEFEIAKYFEQVENDLGSLLRIRREESAGAAQDEPGKIPIATGVPLTDFSSDEKAIISHAREDLLNKGLAWDQTLSEMEKCLEAFTPGPDQNVSQVQRAAVELGSQWQRTRDIISGGAWLRALKELANPSVDDLEKLNQSFFDYIGPRLVGFSGDLVTFLLRFVIASSILLLSLYFFLYDGPGMVRTLMDLSPLDDRYELELLAEFDRISRAIVLATVLSALLQGLVAGVGYYFAGIPSLILLTALTATCALIPFVGPAIVWAPVCVYLAVYEENFWAAGLLALWGMLVVGWVDNIVKMYVLHGQSQLHPLLALLSVLGGIQSLGPIGILVGPMVVVLLQTLLGILRTELTHFRKSEDSPTENAISATEPKSLSGLIRKVKGTGTSSDSESNEPESPMPLGTVTP
ncbi:MAG: AI-2E family transporter [Planctomycetota bacterium]|nr:AI-2E family transporter [Planctomycetota bacterium]